MSNWYFSLKINKHQASTNELQHIAGYISTELNQALWESFALSQALWCMPVISAIGRLRQKDDKLGSASYITRLSQRRKKVYFSIFKFLGHLWRVLRQHIYTTRTSLPIWTSCTVTRLTQKCFSETHWSHQCRRNGVCRNLLFWPPIQMLRG